MFSKYSMTIFLLFCAENPFTEVIKLTISTERWDKNFSLYTENFRNIAM